MNEQLMQYGPSQAAALLGVSIDTLKRWEAEGAIEPPARTPGGHRRYTAQHIEAIKQHAAGK